MALSSARSNFQTHCTKQHLRDREQRPHNSRLQQIPGAVPMFSDHEHCYLRGMSRYTTVNYLINLMSGRTETVHPTNI